MKPPLEEKGRIDALDIYKVFRSYEEHENELLNQRTSWLITVQSVLLATFGFSLQKWLEVTHKSAELDGKIQAVAKAILDKQLVDFKDFLIALAAIGVTTGVVSFMSIRTAITAQESLRSLWEKAHAKRPEVTRMNLPELSGGGDKWASKYGGYFASALPVIFVGLWLVTALLLLFYVGKR